MESQVCLISAGLTDSICLNETLLFIVYLDVSFVAFGKLNDRITQNYCCRQTIRQQLQQDVIFSFESVIKCQPKTDICKLETVPAQTTDDSADESWSGDGKKLAAKPIVGLTVTHVDLRTRQSMRQEIAIDASASSTLGTTLVKCGRTSEIYCTPTTPLTRPTTTSRSAQNSPRSSLIRSTTSQRQ